MTPAPPPPSAREIVGRSWLYAGRFPRLRPELRATSSKRPIDVDEAVHIAPEPIFGEALAGLHVFE